MMLTKTEIEIYRWIDSCPLGCFSYKDKDGTIIIEIKIETEEE